MIQSSKTSTYDIIRVGLPITKDSITQEFIDIVDELENNEEWVGLTLCDYDYSGKQVRLDQHNAPAGYSFLLERGFVFSKNDLSRANKIIGTFGEFWGERNPVVTAQRLMRAVKHFHEKELFSTVVMFTPGSPHHDDSITKVLTSVYPDIRIVDTDSSADIAVKCIGGDCVIRSHYDEFVLGKNRSIDKSKIAIFSCLQHGYNVDLREVILDLQPKQIIAVNIKVDRVTKEVYTSEQVLENIDSLFKSSETYTFGFVW